MLGRIRSTEECRFCGEGYEVVLSEASGDQVDLLCPCGRRPRFYYVDARGIRDRWGPVGRLKTDRQNRRFDSFLSAKRTLDAIRKELDENIFDSTRWAADRRGEHLLSRACDPWLGHLERNRTRTYAWHQRHFLTKHIIPALGDMDVRTIRGLDVELLHGKLLKKKLKENTVRNILTALRSLLSWLHRMDVVPKVPAFPPLGPIPRANVGWIDKADQEKGLDAVRPDVRLLIETMMAAGARPGEGVAWKVRDLDIRRGGIRIERALDRSREVKGTKTRAVSLQALPEDLLRRLAEHARGKLPEAWLFVNRAGRPYHQRQVSWLWRKATKEAGLSVCLSVASRHSRVSQLRAELERRVAEELRGQLAHTSSRTTLKHYARDEREKG